MLSDVSVPVKGFIETSFVDWPGKICSVIFLPYCNLRCRYCHNAALVLEPENITTVEKNRIVSYLAANRGWIDGVCVSGGEPTLHASLPMLLAELRRMGFATKLDTNGTRPDVLRMLIQNGLLDYIAMDVKAPLDEESYCAVTQSQNMLAAVKESIQVILASGIEHEFRCTVLPHFHDPDSIVEIARTLNGAKRLRLQNFNPGETLDPDFEQMQPYADDLICNLQQNVDAVLGVQPETNRLWLFSGTA
ncbi:MAG: anaerobic ribonucleoside-triphosphate reductase activating protein [Desulfobacterota bacterium]|nr:anaerobic ribonucleoside-triphosphate reductase activating protein [Thermodesulfobacteriota bacterium]